MTNYFNYPTRTSFYNLGCSGRLLAQSDNRTHQLTFVNVQLCLAGFWLMAQILLRPRMRVNILGILPLQVS